MQFDRGDLHLSDIHHISRDDVVDPEVSGGLDFTGPFGDAGRIETHVREHHLHVFAGHDLHGRSDDTRNCAANLVGQQPEFLATERGQV